MMKVAIRKFIIYFKHSMLLQNHRVGHSQVALGYKTKLKDC